MENKIQELINIQKEIHNQNVEFYQYGVTAKISTIIFCFLIVFCIQDLPEQTKVLVGFFAFLAGLSAAIFFNYQYESFKKINQ